MARILYKSYAPVITNSKTGESLKVDSLVDWLNENDEIPYSVVYLHFCSYCGKQIKDGNVCSKCWKSEGLEHDRRKSS